MNDRYFDFLEGQSAKISDVAVRGAINRVVKLHREILATTTSVRANIDLSGQGKTKEARAFLSKQAPVVIRANLAAQRLVARVAEKRATIELPAIDKTDAAGAILRGQVRDRLSRMSAQEIRASIATMPPLHLQAILESPELVGVDRATAEAARSQLIEIVHPGKTAELNAELDAVRLLANATTALSEAARDLAGLPNASALTAFLDQAVPDQRHIAADVERETALAA